MELERRGQLSSISTFLTPKGDIVFNKHEKFHQVMDKELEEFLSNTSFENINEFQNIIPLISKHIEKYIDLKVKKI